MAIQAERIGDWDAAAGHWQTILGTAPAEPSVRLSLARALRLGGKCGPAASVLSPMLMAEQQDARALVESAKCHLVSGRPEAAETYLRQAVELSPDWWEALTTLAVSLDRIGRHIEALHYHDRAVALTPDRPQVLSNKALSLALNDQMDEALPLMRTAAAHPAATMRVRMNLAMLEAMAGNGDRAVTIASQENIEDRAATLNSLRRLAAKAGKSGKP